MLKGSCMSPLPWETSVRQGSAGLLSHVQLGSEFQWVLSTGVPEPKEAEGCPQGQKRCTGGGR